MRFVLPACYQFVAHVFGLEIWFKLEFEINRFGSPVLEPRHTLERQPSLDSEEATKLLAAIELCMN